MKLFSLILENSYCVVVWGCIFDHQTKLSDVIRFMIIFRLTFYEILILVDLDIYIYGTVHAKLAYHVFIYKVIKMIHFEIATSPEP